MIGITMAAEAQHVDRNNRDAVRGEAAESTLKYTRLSQLPAMVARNNWIVYKVNVAFYGNRWRGAKIGRGGSPTC